MLIIQLLNLLKLKFKPHILIIIEMIPFALIYFSSNSWLSWWGRRGGRTGRDEQKTKKWLYKRSTAKNSL